MLNINDIFPKNNYNTNNSYSFLEEIEYYINLLSKTKMKIYK